MATDKPEQTEIPLPPQPPALTMTCPLCGRTLVAQRGIDTRFLVAWCAKNAKWVQTRA